MACDSSEDETDRRIRAEIRALLAAPQKRTRQPVPPHLRTREGRIALSLWRQQAWYSAARSRYESWWLGLDSDTRTSIKRAAAAFDTIEQLREAYFQHSRPSAGRFEVGPEGARFDELREELPELDSYKYIALLRQPVARRSRYAEAFGKQVTRVLKEFLEVPAHRPRFKPSEADLEDDEWLRRLAAYIWHFPENVF